jgi:hypothetical protein
MGLALGARRSSDLDAAEAYLIRLCDEPISSAAGEHLLLVELRFTAELRGDAESLRSCGPAVRSGLLPEAITWAPTRAALCLPDVT